MENLKKLTFIDLSKKRNKLGEKVCTELGIKSIPTSINKFSSGETIVNIESSVRGQDIYLLQTFDENINDQIMEILICVDALKRASANEINLIVPLFPYSRQDRKTKSREPISAKLVANLLEQSGVNRIITFDLHASQVQGFFNIPSDNYFALPILSQHLQSELDDLKNVVIVSPDHGGVNRARKLAQTLDSPIAIIDKRRPKPNVSVVTNIIGEVSNKTAIIIDDMIDTAGSLCNAADFLISKGAKKVYAVATHPIFSGPAIERITNSSLQKVIVTDSISCENKKINEKIEVISIDKLIARAVEHTFLDKPVSEIFENGID